MRLSAFAVFCVVCVWVMSSRNDSSSRKVVLAAPSIEAGPKQEDDGESEVIVDPLCEGHHSCGQPCENCHADNRGAEIRAIEETASGDDESISAVQDWLAGRQAVTWLYGPVQYLPANRAQPWMVAGHVVTVTRIPSDATAIRAGMYVEVRGIRQLDGAIVAMQLNLCGEEMPACFRPMPSSAGVTETSSVAASVTPEEIGKLVFLKIGCQACHTIAGVAEGAVAPPLSAIYTAAGNRLKQADYLASLGKATTPEAYILESIVSPRAYVVPVCPAGLCDTSAKPQNYRDVLKPDELAALVAYLSSLGRTPSLPTQEPPIMPVPHTLSTTLAAATQTPIPAWLMTLAIIMAVSLAAIAGGTLLALAATGVSQFLQHNSPARSSVGEGGSKSSSLARPFIWPSIALAEGAVLACLLAAALASAQMPVTPPATGPAPTSAALAEAPLPVVLLPTLVPAPEGGYVKGRVVWNGAPIKGVQVSLCNETSYALGCVGEAASVQSDADGQYLMADVPPGEYNLALRAPGSEQWIYITEGLGINPARYTVDKDQTLHVADQSLYQFDLQLLEPAPDSSVTSDAPVLKWAQYPDADWYEIYLAPEKGDAVFARFQATSNELAVTEPLQNCGYYWQVEAISRQHGKLAESNRRGSFNVTGQPVSCVLELAAPANDAEIGGKEVELVWAAHPRATSYTLLLWNESSPEHELVLDRVAVGDTRYRVTDELEPGTYVWAVYAFDATGRQVAGSEVRRFSVK